MPDPSETNESRFSDLLELCRMLRAPQGCPWDRAQSVRTLGRYLVEESFEALHAARSSDPDRTATELGDLAFVLALTMVTAESEGIATPSSILDGAIEKIRRRHPHVFDDPVELTERELSLQWEAGKQRESGGDPATGHLAAADPAQPGLNQARELQERAAEVGFDWREVTPVLDKLREELAELVEVIESPERRSEELGDLLFSTVNLARFLDVDPEAAMRAANEKFRKRFNRMLDLMRSEEKAPQDLTLEELDGFWNAVKASESNESRERAH